MVADPYPACAVLRQAPRVQYAALAGLERQRSFATVLRRMPRLVLLEELAWKQGDVIRGLQELRVRT